eukprot:g2131.t1
MLDTVHNPLCDPAVVVQALKSNSSKFFLSSRQLRQLIGVFERPQHRIELSFPYMQPEFEQFHFNFHFHDERACISNLLAISSREDPGYIRNPVYILPDGTIDPLKMGIPRSWEMQDRVPVGGTFKCSYVSFPVVKRYLKEKNLDLKKVFDSFDGADGNGEVGYIKLIRGLEGLSWPNPEIERSENELKEKRGYFGPSELVFRAARKEGNITKESLRSLEPILQKAPFSKAELDEVCAEIQRLDDDEHIPGINDRWGFMTRVGLHEKSHLFRQDRGGEWLIPLSSFIKHRREMTGVEKYADIYTSRVSNLLPYTPFNIFRPPLQSDRNFLDTGSEQAFSDYMCELVESQGSKAFDEAPAETAPTIWGSSGHLTKEHVELASREVEQTGTTVALRQRLEPDYFGASPQPP